jgi:hypothetical protein
MRFQSMSSSSATSIGIAVMTPCPISIIESMMRTESSALIVTQTFGSKTPAAFATPPPGTGR